MCGRTLECVDVARVPVVSESILNTLSPASPEDRPRRAVDEYLIGVRRYATRRPDG